MGIGAKLALAGAAVFGALVVFSFFYWMNVNNSCVRSENDLAAQYDQNQSNLANYSNKVMEMIQVPEAAKKAILELTTAAIQGRYGKEGSKAVFQAIQEQNPTVDPVLYRQLEQAIEAGRNSFEADQRSLLDRRRQYQNYYQTMPTSLFASMMGFPRVDLKKYDPVITDDTAKAFSTKRSGPLKLQ